MLRTSWRHATDPEYCVNSPTLFNIVRFANPCSVVSYPMASSVVRPVPLQAPRSQQKANVKSSAFNVQLFLGCARLGRKVAKFRAKETVFVQGGLAKSVMYLQEGGVKLTVVNEVGKEAVVAILGAGDFLGEGCLAGQALRMASATSMSECSIMRLEKTSVIRLLHDQPAFSELMLRHLLSRNIRIEEDLVDQLFNSS